MSANTIMLFPYPAPGFNKPVLQMIFAITNAIKQYGVSSVNIRLFHMMENRGLFQIDFVDINDDDRMLTIHYDCDESYQDTVPGPKFILSLGASGNSVVIMKAIADHRELSWLSRPFLCENDSEEGLDQFYRYESK